MLLPRGSSTSAPERGALRPWPSVLVTWGPGAQSKRHAHHCWHLLLGLDATLQIQTTQEGRMRRALAAITRPDAAHAVDARGTRVVIVFIDPESEAGDRLDATFTRDPVSLLDAGTAQRLRALTAQPSRLADRISELFAVLGAPSAAPILRHRGVRRVLRHLKDAAPDADTSLEALAGIAGLSPGRFMHVFTHDVGVPLRPYLAWLRLERAASAIARGAALSQAAHVAGFADAAHMTRSFRRMYGVTPSELRQRFR